MTDESFNLDITNVKFSDLRRKRKSYRRIGKSPPAQVSVKITVQAYDIITYLAYAEGMRHSPFYELVDVVIELLAETKQKLQEKEDFLLLAHDQERIVRQERDALRKRIEQLVITKNNDSGVSLP